MRQSRRSHGLASAACVSLFLSACAAPGTPGAAAGYVEQACRTTAEGYTVCEPSAPLPSGATPPPPATRVAASDNAFAGVPLGTAVEAAKPRLIAALGQPEEASESSCLKPELRNSLAQPVPGQRLAWRDLEVRVFFTEASSGSVVLTGWQVTAPRQPPSPYAFDLPYDVRLEEPANEAAAKIPQSRRQKIAYGAAAGSTVITTPAMPSLSFDLSPGDEETVYGSSYDPEGCG